MYTRNVPLAIITNFENYMVLERQSSPTSTEVVLCSEIFSSSSVSSQMSLHKSPFGLFLAVTLRACSLRKLRIPGPANDFDDDSISDSVSFWYSIVR